MSARDATDSIQQLLESLEQLSPMLPERKDDLQFLRDMLLTNEFHSLIRLHREVSNATIDHPKVSGQNALALANIITFDCELESIKCPEAKELVHLLSSPHIEALIAASDKISNKEYPMEAVPTSTNTTMQQLSGSQPVRVVHIEKGTDPLGATVKSDQEGNIIVSRVLVGGAADKCGMLSAGDTIHSVNGENVHGLSVDDVANLMKGLSGNVSFMITPATTETRVKRWEQSAVYMRTLFSYDPSVDERHPCSEAGLKFDPGNVLQIVDQEDPDWWQAVRDGDKRARAGIIPSKSLTERREMCGNVQQGPTRKRSKVKATQFSMSSVGSGNEIISYEEVVKINPQVERPRPIMLVAPRGPPFDLEGIKAKLLQQHPDMYGSPIAHTSREHHINEENSVDFYFVSRRQIEQDIENNKFVEHAFYDGHYYGISINSIRKVINEGKTCVLVVAPQSIRYVRTSEIRPFIVYLKPPTADYMKQNWVQQKWIKESSIADLIRQATHLEQTYGQFIDHTILFSSQGSAQKDIAQVANRLRKDQQWVPEQWTKIW